MLKADSFAEGFPTDLNFLEGSQSEHQTSDPTHDCIHSSPSVTGIPKESSPSVSQFQTDGRSSTVLPPSHPPISIEDFLSLRRGRMGRGRAFGAARSAQQRFSERPIGSISVLDLANTDLHQLKKSFAAHAKTFSRAELSDINQMAVNVLREMRLMDKAQLRRQQLSAQGVSLSRAKMPDNVDGDVLMETTGSTVSTMEGSLHGMETGNAMEPASQRTRMMSIWIYDLLVQERLASLLLKKKGMGVNTSHNRDFPGIFPGGIKRAVNMLRSPPVPSQMSGFDIYDEMYERLRALDANALIRQEDIGLDNLELPLPVFVYVFSRAIFRQFYMSRFPAEVFTASEESSLPSESPDHRSLSPSASALPGNTMSQFDRTNKSTFFSQCSSGLDDVPANGQEMIHEVSCAMDSCRRAVFNFFEFLDTEQLGTMSWSTFTDALMEQVEVQHRVMMDKENYEEVAHTDARVFDKYVVHPFPAVLQRLGYVGAVTELRHSGSAVIIEGPHDFAVCDSAYSGIIKRKLFVRTDIALFSHLTGATDTWDAERWDAMADTAFTPTHEPAASRKFQHFEDGRRRDERAAATGKCNDDDDINNNSSTGDRNNRFDGRRTKPSIVSALQIRDVGTDLPPVIATMHNDMLLRFFRTDVHLWLLPETLTIKFTETLTVMDWCGTGGDSDAALRGILFIGLRCGVIYRLDLAAILRRMTTMSHSVTDFLTTGAAAAATLNEHVETFLLQKFAVHKDVVTSLSLSAGGILLSASLDGNVVLSRAATLTPVRTFRADSNAGVRFACVTPLRNAIVTLTTSNRLSLWGNTAQSTPIELYDPLGPHYFPITAVRVDEDLDQLITLDSSGFVKIWSFRRCLPSTSFYAVMDQCFSTFRRMYSKKKGGVGEQHNGHRLFDVDEKEGRRPRVSAALGAIGDAANSGGSGRGPSLANATFANIEMAAKAVALHPAKYMAYDWVAKRFFVSGVRNSALCVFTGGATALTAHDEPLCHMAVCERNRWLISTSVADCRVWRLRTGVMTLGIKVDSVEFNAARVSPAFPLLGASGVIGDIANKIDVDAGRLVLDTCKQPQTTLREVMRDVNMATRRRRVQEREGFTGVLTRSYPNNINKSGITSGGEVLQETSGARSAVFGRQGTNGNAALGGTSLNDTTEKDIVENSVDAQGMQLNVLCSHVDYNERFIFYALRSGDIRMHRTDSGRLVKTFMTIPPSQEVILTAVFQSRHLLQSKQANSDQRASVLSEESTGEIGSHRKSFTMSVLGGMARLHDVATVLRRLLHSDDKASVGAGTDRLSIHREVIGLMTPSSAQELGVAYADGIIRFYSLIGSTVHSQRIVIPEFLVARAVACLNIARQSLHARLPLPSYPQQQQQQQQQQQLKQPQRPQEPPHSGRHPHGQTTAAPCRAPSVEADAVSLITVSNALNFLCLVQVNGRISLIDMSTQTGVIVQSFVVSGELTAVSFLGSYPCLVVANAQGRVSFFLVKGSSLLSLMDDFLKSVSLHHRNLREQPWYFLQYQELLDDSGTNDGNRSLRSNAGEASSTRKGTMEQNGARTSDAKQHMWGFRTAGVPSALHFDHVHCVLYVGTRQGFVSSYLVRNLVVAFDLNPPMNISQSASLLSNSSTLIASLRHMQKEANERRLFNILFVLFDITQQRMARYVKKLGSASMRHVDSQKHIVDHRMEGSRRGFVSFRCDGHSKQDLERQFGSQANPPSFSTPVRLPKGSLAQVFESYRPLFYMAQSRNIRGEKSYLVDLYTVTLTDLLVSSAVLHHSLLLMPRRRTGQPTVNTEGNLSAATLNADDLSHLRQCIAEEVRYHNQQCREDQATHANVLTAMKMFSSSFSSVDNPKESNSIKSEALPLNTPRVQHFAEGEYDISALEGSRGECFMSITDDWVELLFRRHVLQSVSNSPLALLTPNGAIERARRERYERLKLLQLQANLEGSHKPFPSASRSQGSGAGTSAVISVSVDSDAFLEGASPDVVADVLGRRSPVLQRDDEEALGRLLEGDVVRSIASRRNGFVFIGCGNGSISMWAPFLSARFEQLSPCVLLEESIYRLGEAVKAQFTKKVEEYAQEQQREAFASRGYSREHHEKLMRNLYVGYKVAVMKSEANRVQEQERRNSHRLSTNSREASNPPSGMIGRNDLQEGKSLRKYSSTDPFGSSGLPSTSLTGRISRNLGGGAGLDNVPQNLLSQDALADRTVRRRLVEGERALLITVLGLQPVHLAQRGLLVEDLYFLPLHMSMLTELEKFNVPAYEAAVDLAVLRLIRELRSVDFGDADAGAAPDGPRSNSARLMSEDGRVIDDDERSAVAANAVWTPNPNSSGGCHDKAHTENDRDDVLDDAVRFNIHVHARHVAAFFTDQQHRRFARECVVSFPRRTPSGDAVAAFQHSRVGRTSLLIGSPLRDSTSSSSLLPGGLVSWMPLASTELPSYARAGLETSAGFLTLSTTLRRNRRLLGCHALDLTRVANAASWSLAADAMRPTSGGGAGGNAEREKEMSFAAQYAWLQEPLLLAPAAVTEDGKSDRSVLAQSQVEGNNDADNSDSNLSAMSTGTEKGKKRYALFTTQPLVQVRRTVAAGSAAALMTGEVSDASLSDETVADAPMQWSLRSKKHTHRARLAATGCVEQPGKKLPEVRVGLSLTQKNIRAQEAKTQKASGGGDELRRATRSRLQGRGQQE